MNQGLAIHPDNVEKIPSGALAATAPAKINLALHVTGQLPDGYHLIETLSVFTRFGDRLIVAPADRDMFEIDGPFAGALASNQPNLVTRARDTLRNSCPVVTAPPVAIRLEKNLPVASGIGGGSSDAACTLKLLSALWKLDVSDSELRRIGIALGADIPMCLAGEPLIARGVGDELEMVSGFPSLHLLLVNPGIAVPTGEVFARLECKHNKALAKLPSTLTSAGLVEWLGATRNDLQRPASGLAHSITEAGRPVTEYGAVFARMSGSGATVFGVFERRVSIAVRRKCDCKAKAAMVCKGNDDRRYCLRLTPVFVITGEFSGAWQFRTKAVRSGRIAVLTVSDTRTLEDDRSGNTLAERIVKAGHRLAQRSIVTDDIEQIRSIVTAWSKDESVDAIITTGGTGLPAGM